MRFGVVSVQKYYAKHWNYQIPNLSFLQFKIIFKILINIDEDKDVSLDNLSGKFLKDGASVSAKPISQTCNLLWGNVV